MAVEQKSNNIQVFGKIRKILESIYNINSLDDWVSLTEVDICDIMDVSSCDIYLVDQNLKKLYSPSDKQHIEISDHTAVGYAANHLATIQIPNEQFHPQKISNQVIAAITFRKKLFGVLCLSQPYFFTEKQIKSINEISEILAISLHQHYKIHKNYLARYNVLISKSIIPAKLIHEAVITAHKHKKAVEEILMEHYEINKTEILDALEEYFGVPKYTFKAGISLSNSLSKKLDPEYLKNNLWVPIGESEDSVSIAMEYPCMLDKLDDIKRLINVSKYNFYVALKEDVIKTIDYLWQKKQHFQDMETLLGELQGETVYDEIDTQHIVDESSHIIIRLVHKIIEDAHLQNASDIHIEPCWKKKLVRVRFRIDGECSDYKILPYYVRKAVVSRIKIMANMDISKHMSPQDGKIQMKKYGPRDVELRVVTVPTIHDNEDAVLRILASGDPLPLEKLGIIWGIENFQKMIQTPYGIVLVVGPTGSGKTTTLHSVIKMLNTSSKKIWTLEDPVEITQEGIRQVQINTRAGITFANSLRSFLRADPDIIMIGEIRDLETAKIAIESSLTGHLVLSTLHTNNAPETISRILEMGIEPEHFAEALIGILAQRLVKTLCSNCKSKTRLLKKDFDYFIDCYGSQDIFERHNITFNENMSVYNAKGCNICQNGYKGRIGIYEILAVTNKIKILIQQRKTIGEIRQTAIENGMVTLKQDGILKILSGYTDIRQVLAVSQK